MTNPVGRPSKYGPEIIEKARQYVDEFGENDKETVPTIAGLARFLGVSRETVYAWSREEGNEAFSDIVKQVDINREILLVNGGLKGMYNPTITALMMGQLGYRKEASVEHSGKDGGPIKTQSNIVFVPVGSDDDD
jgi:AraC-like DNA-binding protein